MDQVKGLYRTVVVLNSHSSKLSYLPSGYLRPRQPTENKENEFRFKNKSVIVKVKVTDLSINKLLFNFASNQDTI